MSLENRVDKIEEAILIMKDLLVSHNDRLDDYYKALEESREDFEFKLNALIDSQMRNESIKRSLAITFTENCNT